MPRAEAARELVASRAYRALGRVVAQLESDPMLVGDLLPVIYRLLKQVEGSAYLLTQNQAARRLGVSPRRMGQFVKEGRLAAFRLWSHILIAEEHLRAFEGHERRAGRPSKGRHPRP